jgi:hypothetical protein
MSDSIATSGKPSSQEKLLQYRLLGTTVPLKQGGGAVFPGGFPGKGYLLDDWQFDRYRAQLDRTTLSDEAGRRGRLLFVLLLLLVGGLVLAAFALPELKSNPRYAPYMDSWLPLALLFLVAFGGSRLLRSLVLPAGPAASELDGAPRVSRFAFLGRRALGMLASGQVSVVACHLRAFVGGFACLLILPGALLADGTPVESILLLVVFFLWASRAAFFCFTYWRFRLGRGRAPTPADLKPV